MFNLLSKESLPFSCKAALQLGSSQNILVHGVISPEGQEFALALPDVLKSCFADFLFLFIGIIPGLLFINPLLLPFRAAGNSLPPPSFFVESCLYDISHPTGKDTFALLSKDLISSKNT